ncbi:hypothetical protein HDU96_008554 [Phlyctochytrium bullatum]|nr:hypothetical protein HDU96_008554 [Phlyctochytrium bullatum]
MEILAAVGGINGIKEVFSAVGNAITNLSDANHECRVLKMKLAIVNSIIERDKDEMDEKSLTYIRLKELAENIAKFMEKDGAQWIFKLNSNFKENVKKLCDELENALTELKWKDEVDQEYQKRNRQDEIFLFLYIHTRREAELNLKRYWRAVEKGDFSSLKESLKLGKIDPNETNDSNDLTALQMLTSGQKIRYKMVEELLEHGANVDDKDEEGLTLLEIACQKNDHKLVKILLKFNATPIHAIMRSSKPAVWTAFAEKRTDLNGDLWAALRAFQYEKGKKDSGSELSGERARLILGKSGNPKEVATKRDRFVMSGTYYGVTTYAPLEVAAYHCSAGVVEAILLCGAEANEQETKFKKTALHWAATRGDLEIVKLLVDRHEAKVDVEDSQGKTPLQLAIEKAEIQKKNKLNREVVKFLLTKTTETAHLEKALESANYLVARFTKSSSVAESTKLAEAIKQLVQDAMPSKPSASTKNGSEVEPPAYQTMEATANTPLKKAAVPAATTSKLAENGIPEPKLQESKPEKDVELAEVTPADVVKNADEASVIAVPESKLAVKKESPAPYIQESKPQKDVEKAGSPGPAVLAEPKSAKETSEQKTLAKEAPPSKNVDVAVVVESNAESALIKVEQPKQVAAAAITPQQSAPEGKKKHNGVRKLLLKLLACIDARQ